MSAGRTALLAAAAGAATVTGVRAGGRALVRRTERRLCVTVEPPPYDASERARELHRRLGSSTSTPTPCCGAATSCDGPAGPRRRAPADRGQRRAPGPGRQHEVAAPPQHRAQRRPQRRHHAAGPRRWLAAGHLAQPPRPRAAHGRRGPTRWPAVRRPVHAHPVRADLERYLARRATEPAITAGLLAIEGAHALDDDPANVDVVADAGYRMMSPSHFFDNAFGGSAHGIEKGGLTAAGPRDDPRGWRRAR